MLIKPSFTSGKQSLHNAIQRAGFVNGNGLYWSFDFAHASCDAGAAATEVVDLTTLSGGSAQNFYVGAAASVDGDEPTFNGTAGSFDYTTTYRSFDGGDKFRGTAAHTNSSPYHWHKNSSKRWCLAWVYLVAHSDHQGFMGDSSGGSVYRGFMFGLTAAEQLRFRVGPNQMDKISDDAVTLGQPVLVGCAHYQGEGGWGFFYEDGAYKQVGGADYWTSQYPSPSANDPAHTVEIGAAGNAAYELVNGSRMYSLAYGNINLSEEEATQYESNPWEAWKQRFDRFYDITNGWFS